MSNKMQRLEKLAQLLRYWILLETTSAGSGHPSSSLSAVEMMTALFFGGVLRLDPKNQKNANNDNVIFSKGHAAPLLYALLAAAGIIPEKELATLRREGSRLEGHPSVAVPFVKVATGSLGQGLSQGVGMAWHARYVAHSPATTYVLLGDSEMAEGSNYEAMASAAHYRLGNLVALLDVNRLGQTGPTQLAYDLSAYKKRVEAFGWKAIVVEEGHNFGKLLVAFLQARRNTAPTMIIAKTLKGKSVKTMENKNGWHGKALDQVQFAAAVKDLAPIDLKVRGVIARPLPGRHRVIAKRLPAFTNLPSLTSEPLATRKAFGIALVRAAAKNNRIVALDAEVGNSTFTEYFKQFFPERFIQSYIAEQNMVGVATGLSAQGMIPFAATFGAFLTRAHDQIRMAQYSKANLKLVGSHVGVSIGEDGPSQMALEDLAMMRAINGSTVLYPADAIATAALVKEMVKHYGIDYLRTTRMDTPNLYKPSEKFPIGGSRVLRQSKSDVKTIVAAGITVHEALKTYDKLRTHGVSVRVIDCYSVKPIDAKTLIKAARETKSIVVIEDHYPEGGLADAVRKALLDHNVRASVASLAVEELPHSATPEQQIIHHNLRQKTSRFIASR